VKFVAILALAEQGEVEEEHGIVPTSAELSCWKPKETALQHVLVVEWLDKHACGDGEGKGWGCCGGAYSGG